jgi:hypothetical protein
MSKFLSALIAIAFSATTLQVMAADAPAAGKCGDKKEAAAAPADAKKCGDKKEAAPAAK